MKRWETENLKEELRKLDNEAIEEAIKESFELIEYKKMVKKLEKTENIEDEDEIRQELRELDLEIVQKIEEKLDGYSCDIADTELESWESFSINIYASRIDAMDSCGQNYMGYILLDGFFEHFSRFVSLRDDDGAIKYDEAIDL